MNQFYKGRTNNHLTWVMVDATDFATPESAVSAATTIKIYGKLRGGTGVNFVSSGAGSLTNDIVHVGASATGIYTIALVKADLSDASAAWYDQYVITLSATGCARQTLVVDGGIDASALSTYQSRISDIQSYLVALSGVISDAHSAAILAASNASEAQSHATLAASRALLNQSRISDVQSYLIAMSDSLSDIGSDLRSYMVGLSASVSDLQSALSDAHSDLKSAIGAITVTISASDVSDIASAVVAGITINSTVSDIYSLLSDLNSNFNSRVPKEPAARSQLSDLASDVKSAITVVQSQASDTYSMLSDALSGPMTASDLSDIASAVWAHTIGARVDSRVLVVQSAASDAASAATQANSRVLLNQSRVSDIYSLLSDVGSDLTVMSGILSDAYSNITALPTRIASAAVADPLHVNIHEINDVSLIGDGSGTPWGPL